LKNNIILPKREKETHKGDYGRVLIVAGSSGMLGAGILASRSALRTGSGLVYLAVPKELKDIANIATPEVIVKSFDDIDSIKPDVIVIGPGLSTSKNAKSITEKILLSSKVPLVIDADALNTTDVHFLNFIKAPFIITPHPKELERLIDVPASEIQKNREFIAKNTAKKINGIIVLKGSNTVVADKRGNIYINKTGNPGMATAGSGDVLSGIIASFIGQGIEIFLAAKIGVNVHGLAGDLACKEMGEYGLIASDIIDHLPKALLKLQNAKKL